MMVKSFREESKENWQLKSLSFDEGFNIILEVITKQLEIDKESITLADNLITDHDADSVDIVAMLLYLEEIFKNSCTTGRIAIPTDKLGQIVYVGDLLTLIYEALLEVENKNSSAKNFKITPNLQALANQQKIGELYNNKD